jgi:hypothetical protein
MSVLSVGRTEYALRLWPWGVYTDRRRVLAHLDRTNRTIDVDAGLSKEQVAQVVAQVLRREMGRALRRVEGSDLSSLPVVLVPIIGRTPAGPSVSWEAPPGSALLRTS